LSDNIAVVPPPARRRIRWISFVAGEGAPGRRARGLHEETNPQHRLRVEHDDRTLLIHLSDEDGEVWTTIAVDRATRGFRASASAGRSCPPGPRGPLSALTGRG